MRLEIVREQTASDDSVDNRGERPGSSPESSAAPGQPEHSSQRPLAEDSHRPHDDEITATRGVGRRLTSTAALIGMLMVARILLGLVWVQWPSSMALGEVGLRVVSSALLVALAASWAGWLGGGSIARLSSALAALSMPALWLGGRDQSLVVLGALILLASLPLLPSRLVGPQRWRGPRAERRVRGGGLGTVALFFLLCGVVFGVSGLGGDGGARHSPLILGPATLLLVTAGWWSLVRVGARSSGVRPGDVRTEGPAVWSPVAAVLALWIALTSVMASVAALSSDPQLLMASGMTVAVVAGVGVELAGARTGRPRAVQLACLSALVVQLAAIGWLFGFGFR